MNRKDQATGFTLMELLVVVTVICILLGLILPNLRFSREAARRMGCSNNIKQVGLSLHNYHSVYQQLPMQMGGTFDPNGNRGGMSPPGNNRYRLSFLVGLMPFMEQQTTWEQIASGYSDDFPPTQYAPMGPAPWTKEFKPWRTEIPTLRCPSDPERDAEFGRTNVAACLGDATDQLHHGVVRWDAESSVWAEGRTEQAFASGRGAFLPRHVFRFEDITDGLANTIIGGEIITDNDVGDVRTSASIENAFDDVRDQPLLCADQRDPISPQDWLAGQGGHPDRAAPDDQRRGGRWADGAALYSGFNTILPPNREVCLAGGTSGIGMVSASSAHVGGAHVLMGDGAVIFITDSIDCGDLKSGTVYMGGVGSRAPGSHSPFGLWGALGTRAVDDPVEEPLNQ